MLHYIPDNTAHDFTALVHMCFVFFIFVRQWPRIKTRYRSQSISFQQNPYVTLLSDYGTATPLLLCNRILCTKLATSQWRAILLPQLQLYRRWRTSATTSLVLRSIYRAPPTLLPKFTSASIFRPNWELAIQEELDRKSSRVLSTLLYAWLKKWQNTFEIRKLCSASRRASSKTQTLSKALRKCHCRERMRMIDRTKQQKWQKAQPGVVCRRDHNVFTITWATALNWLYRT